MPVASSMLLPAPVSSSTFMSITLVSQPRDAIPRPSLSVAAMIPVTNVPCPLLS